VLFGHDNFDLVVTEKKRDLNKTHISKALSLYGDVKNKVTVIIDDVSTSGSTLINSAEFAMEQGATSTIAAIVHRDFANTTADKIQQSNIEAFFTTDSIAERPETKFEKLQELSIAEDIARVLKEIPI
jgi:ribose-phosphate pyrophosphokinase